MGYQEALGQRSEMAPGCGAEFLAPQRWVLSTAELVIGPFLAQVHGAGNGDLQGCPRG